MIKVENVTRRYDNRVAVSDISFEIEDHGVVGFLGPNGAGKTTMMRMITGCLVPTSGDIWVAGCNMSTGSLEGRRQTGFLPEAVPLYGEMTVRSYLEFAARLRGLRGKAARNRAAEVAEECGVLDQWNVILKRLSRGYRQRVGLAQAIVHDPKVLVLDEPTAGVDPIQVVQTRKLISELGQRRTVLLSTHILSEVSAICRRVIIINKGRLIAQERIEDLPLILSQDRQLKLTVRGPTDAICKRLEAIDAGFSVSYREPHHFVSFPRDVDAEASIAKVIVDEGWVLTGMETVEMSVEDIFLQLTGAADT